MLSHLRKRLITLIMITLSGFFVPNFDVSKKVLLYWEPN